MIFFSFSLFCNSTVRHLFTFVDFKLPTNNCNYYYSYKHYGNVKFHASHQQKKDNLRSYLTVVDLSPPKSSLNERIIIK